MLRLKVLGQCLIELGDQAYAPSSTHFFGLLLRLGADAGRYQERAALSRLLFPAVGDTKSAAHSMRQLFYLAATRGAILERSSGSIRVAGGSVTSDYEELIATDQASVSAAIRRVDVLPDYLPAFGDEFSEWLDSFRQATHARIRHALAAAMEPLRRRADWGRLEARAKELLSLDPLSETGTLALAECLARTGSKEQAVSMLETYRDEVQTRDPSIAVPANVLRKRIERDTMHTRTPRQFTRFVGRAEDLVSLQEDLAIAKTGRITSTLILGDSGCGKTRLAQEYVSLLAYGGGTAVVSLFSSDTDSRHPYSFLSSLIRRLQEQRGAAGADPHLRAYLDRLTGDASPLPNPPRTPDDAKTITDGMYEALLDLVSAVATEKPVVLLIDDSRCIDGASLDVLSALISSRIQIPLHLVVVGSSIDDGSRLSQWRSNRLALKPLSLQEAGTLLESLSDTAHLTEQEKHWCALNSGGNPTFLLLLATECTYAEHGPQLSDSIVAAVDASLSRVSPVGLRVLEACVILAGHCTTTLLTSVVGITSYAMLSALDELEQSGKLLLIDGTVRIRSDLIAERTRRRASESVLATLHSRAAAALAEEANTPERPWRIIEHWRAAGQLWRARREMRAAWNRSISLGQVEQAEASIQSFLRSTGSVDDRIELLEELATTAKTSGNHLTAIHSIDARTDLLKVLGRHDPLEAPMAFDRLAMMLPLHDNPVTHVGALRTFATSSDLDDDRRARAFYLLLVAADSNADPDLATGIFQAFLEMEADVASRPTSELGIATLIYHTVFGSLDTAAALAAQTIDAPSGYIFESSQYRARINAALALSITGDVESATSALRRTFAEVSSYKIRPAMARTAAKIASISFDAGDISEARRWLSEADRLLSKNALETTDPEYVSAKIDIALLDGDPILANHWLAFARSSLPIYKSPRYEMDWLAATVRVACLDGGEISRSTMDTLMSWHVRARSLGRHDDCMYALWACMWRAGREEEASALLRNYMQRFRRERRPCRYWLREFASADPYWKEA